MPCSIDFKMLPSGLKAVHPFTDTPRNGSVSNASDDSSIDEVYYGRSERPRTLLGRILNSLGMNTRRRRQTEPDLDYFSASRDELADDFTKNKVSRRDRQTNAFGLVRKILLVLPIVVLVIL